MCYTLHVISLKVTQAKSLWQKSKGLLGTVKAYPLLLKTRWGIHTFGMCYPIDVIVLNQNNSIMKTKENLTPNKIFLWNPWYDHIVELPAGYIKEKKLKKGEILVITE